MDLLTSTKCKRWLREHGMTEAVRAVRELPGGVSNAVFLVEFAEHPPIVVKQSRKRLRTQRLWISQLERIHREADVLKFLHSILPSGVVPEVLIEDRKQFAIAMRAAGQHSVWKTDILGGEVRTSVAIDSGRALGSIHGLTREHPKLAQRWADQTVFEELRLTPFYESIIEAHPHIDRPIRQLIEQSRIIRETLVLGDFSPKNLLVTSDGLTLVDFETSHFGDPSFDLGFFLSHLFLKRIFHHAKSSHTAEAIAQSGVRFLEAYRQVFAGHAGETECEAVMGRARMHFAACMLSRIDGVSPVDYLDEQGQSIARVTALAWIVDPPEHLLLQWKGEFRSGTDR